MKIGVFDSGLGGLFVLKALLQNKHLRKYDFLFLADTKNLPYGNQSQKKIYDLTLKAINYLFEQNCQLVIVACNTVSAQALRKIQQVYLPKSKYKDRKVLGVIRPTVEMVSKSSGLVGVIGTNRTIASKAYIREFKNFNPKLKLHQLATPLLVPLIEAGNTAKMDEVLSHYLKHFEKLRINTLVLGCTHYGLIKGRAQRIMGKNVKVISQEELLPAKLKGYLDHHKDIEKKLSRNGKTTLAVTKLNSLYTKKFKLVKY